MVEWLHDRERAHLYAAAAEEGWSVSLVLRHGIEGREAKAAQEAAVPCIEELLNSLRPAGSDMWQQDSPGHWYAVLSLDWPRRLRRDVLLKVALT